MTKEEAIRIISGEVLGTTEQTHEAVAMAVEALSAQYQQVTGKLNSDCISRRDAIDAVRRLQTYKLSEGDDMLLVDKAEVQTELMMLPSAQREFAKDTNVPINDCISRQAAIDAPKRFTKDCNPEHFVGHSNFIEYMDTVGIRSFGNWQYANGFNMGLTAAEVAIEKLPSAQRKGKWIATQEWGGRNYSCSCCKFSFIVDTCMLEPMWNFCPNCGAEMKGESDGKI